MKLSIITVSFNSASSIAATLDSIAAQTHPEIEHIVIDGGSTDSTVAIVRERGKHVAHLVSEPDQGIYDAMNKGLRLATGDYVGFLNADDMLAAPDTLAQIAATATASGADIVYGDLLYVDKDCPSQLVRYWRSGEFSAGRLRFGWMPPHPTLYVRKPVQAAIGEFDLRLRIAADYDFMLRCLTRADAQVAYLPQVLVHMRTGGASNRSLAALRAKSREDLFVLRKNRVGGWFTLLCKNFRKLPQFFRKPEHAT
jgi:glycosyltransferase